MPTESSEDILKRELQYATIFDWMETNKVEILTVRFNGEGDSGAFDDYIEMSLQNREYNHAEYTRIHDTLDTIKTIFSAEEWREASLSQLIKYLSETIEKEAHHSVDWWNDDGGQGSVQWILDGEGEDGNHYHHGICLTVARRVIEYDTGYYAVHGKKPESEPKPEQEAA